jgi:Cft2 family RNA processing exonuclease
MRVDFRPEGIHLPEIKLWLDPAMPTPAAWLSHAHSDHARGLHETVIATSITAKIYRHRWPLEPGASQQTLLLDPLQSISWNGATLTCYQAAHILGAAQLLVEYQGERLVYTGDIKRRDPICGWPTQIVPCDRLIIESTFGLPIFRFLEAAEAKQRIVSFANDTLRRGLTPVFQGYGLGRGQEIAHTLASAGIPCSIHGAIAALLPYYESEGYSFPAWQPYVRRTHEPCALIVTPGLQDAVAVPPAKRRTALVSGWAGLDNARARGNCEVLIPYSDHADFDELLQLVEESGAHEVDIVHGYAEPFARILRQRGIDASAAKTASAEEEMQV